MVRRAWQRALSVACTCLAFVACGPDEPVETTGTESSGSGGSGGAEGSGASGGGTGAGGAATTFEAACRGAEKREAACFGQGFDFEACLAEEPCFENFYREDAKAALLGCWAEGGCSNCEGVVAGTIEFTAASTLHRQRCTDFELDCPGANEDICNGADTDDPYWKVFHDDLFDAIAPCFSGACGDFEGCLGQAAASFLAVCGGDFQELR
jgi:hypothetical protein